MKLNLQIDELILHDFPDLDQAELLLAIKAALADLVHERGWPPNAAKQAPQVQLPGGTFDLPPHATTTAIGGQVAQAIYDNFGGTALE